MSARVWIDVDNPPQARYLPPFRAAFERRGADVLLTARDAGATFELLRAAGEPFAGVGRAFGKGRRRKAWGLARRTHALLGTVRRGGPRPSLLLSSSRSAAVVARLLGFPAFVVCDYEHVDLSVYRRAGAYLVFPDAIDPAAFVARGFPRERLVPFAGLKEHISLSRPAAASAVDPLADAAGDGVRVLFRPPAEESHYHTEASGRLARALLARLAADGDATVVYAPRYPHQRRALDEHAWRRPPVFLERPLPAEELLGCVDLVVSAGGTMVREAAFLGVPAYSIFGGPVGAVDRRLSDEGRLVLVGSVAEVDRVRVEPLRRRSPIPPRPQLVDELAEELLERAA